MRSKQQKSDMVVPSRRSVRRQNSLGQQVLKRLHTGATGLASGLQETMRSSTSAEYRAWQHQFLTNRLRLYGWLALPCTLTFAAINIYNFVLYPQADIT